MRLVEAADDDFAWILAGEPRARNGLVLPPGGIDEPALIEHVRAIGARLRAHGERGSWMMVCDGEVVGLCGFHRPPSAEGIVEIGYNVAAARRRRGHATAAVAAILAHARTDGRIRVVVAETDADNIGSQRALERNGFERIDVGAPGVIRWRCGLP